MRTFEIFLAGLCAFAAVSLAIAGNWTAAVGWGVACSAQVELGLAKADKRYTLKK